jgi:hypothetical protein
MVEFDSSSAEDEMSTPKNNFQDDSSLVSPKQPFDGLFDDDNSCDMTPSLTAEKGTFESNRPVRSGLREASKRKSSGKHTSRNTKRSPAIEDRLCSRDPSLFHGATLWNSVPLGHQAPPSSPIRRPIKSSSQSNKPQVVWERRINEVDDNDSGMSSESSSSAGGGEVDRNSGDGSIEPGLAAVRFRPEQMRLSAESLRLLNPHLSSGLQQPPESLRGMSV